MSQIKIEVLEKGITPTDRKLKQLGRTGEKTENQMHDVRDSIKLVGQKGAQSIALLDGPLGGVSSRVSSLTSLIGTGGAAGLVGAVAALGAASYIAAGHVSRLAIEADNMARISGLSVDKFNQLAFATSQYGITAEKLGDSFKDTRERIGDFLNGAGGPLQDFADAMGYTKEQTQAFAESVQDMSGKDILIEMVKQLEAGGKSTVQISHALEGMASDMTLLLPLLSNGGAELERLQNKMAMVQNPLTEQDIRTFRDFSESTDMLTASFSNLMQSAVLPMIPTFTRLTDVVANFFAEMNEGSLANLTEELSEVDERILELYEALDNRKTPFGRLENLVSFEATDRRTLENQLKKMREKRGELQAEIDKLNAERNKPAAAESLPSITSPSSTTTPGNNADQIKSQIEALQRSLMTERELAKSVYDERINLISQSKLAQEQADELSLRARQEYSEKIKQLDADPYASKIELLRQSFLTEEELLQQRYDKQLELITNAQITEQEALDLKVSAYTDYITKLDELDQARASKKAKDDAKESKTKQKIDEKTMSNAVDIAGQTSSALGVILGKDSKAYKVAATTEATISTYLAANKALANPGGPAGFALATTAIATGLANVAQINAARFQGGDVSGGSMYNFQERGQAEAFMPKVDGRVISNAQLKNAMNGGGNGVTVVNNIYNQTDSNVSSRPNAQGGEDIYITRDQLPGVMAAEAGNPNSEFNQSITNVWDMGGRS